MTAGESDDDKTRSYIALTPGTSVLHYKILDKIGAGGMGEVYLAVDSKLNRKVALKFLPQHLCQDEDCRKRFTREAQAAAALDHPNIAAIHEVGKYQGRPFFAMQIVEGQSLREVIAGKDLPIDRILEIAIQICEGLQSAHDKGIIHRDIKPSNVLLDSHGRVRIVDFGLASVRGSEQLTKTGSTLGTVGYMSPEQVRGQEVDHRSDLFSLGVVLYELLTKQNPFKRDSEAATLKAVADDNPHPAARYRADLPDSLQTILDKALDKDVKTRYQHADDIKTDLVRIKRTLDTGSSTIGVAPSARRAARVWWVAAAVIIVALVVTAVVIKPWSSNLSADKQDKIMLAVLPFENLGEAEDEYFADGITEEITSRLAGLKSLGVISRTSAYAYKKSVKTLPQIGKELGVDFILEGTLRWDRRGDSSRVLVTPQLIDVRQDAHLWADRYERRLTDIFAVQRDIAVQVVAALDLTLMGEDSSRIEPPMTENMAAYEAFIKGKESYRRLEWDDATEWLEKATQLDPRFAEAWAYLSIVQYREMLSYMGKDSSIARATLDAAETALSLNPHLAAGHLALGQYYYLRANYDRAASEYEIALNEAPNLAEALFQLGKVRRRQGRWAESCHLLQQALIIDPLNLPILGSYIETAKMAREAKDAMMLVDDLASRFPDDLDLKTAAMMLHFHCEGPTPTVRRQLRECIQALSARSLGPEQQKLLIQVLGQAGILMRDTAVVRQALAYFPRFERPDMMDTYYLMAGELSFHQQKTDKARVYFDSARIALETLESGGSEQGRGSAKLFLPWAASRLGDKEKAVALLDSVDNFAKQQGDLFLAYHNLPGRCFVYTAIGEKEKAIACLDSAMASNGWMSVYELKYDMTWGPLRGEPGFEAIIKKYEDPDAI